MAANNGLPENTIPGKGLDILVFAAHPDDAEVGCGGAIALSIEQGLAVGVVDLSGGERASRGNPLQRQAETGRASAGLNLSLRLSLGLPDTRIGKEPAHNLALVQTIRTYRPRIVLAPYFKDRHPDHAATGKLAREACFFAGVKAVGEGSPHRPDQLFFYMLHYPFKPAFILDISSTWPQKIAAIEAYQSQFQRLEPGLATAISGPDFLGFIEVRAKYYGGLIGTSYGEPFFANGPVALGKFPGLERPPPEPGHLPPYRPYL